LDLESEADIRAALEQAGIDASGFQIEAARADRDRCEGELRDAGVIRAPAFLVEDELFIGRAHLPMIRWLLTGRSGPVPI
ncbi:MAG: hypothetical protein R3190_12780, partial [Thermoanaerobaculia bacterium]|nr:hypothetical protein [Thermoanaerobaculia bacterium]